MRHCYGGALLPSSNARLRFGRVAGLWRCFGGFTECCAVLNFQTMYMHGTTLQASLLKVLRRKVPRNRAVVNYPDRYTPRKSPYPLGIGGSLWRRARGAERICRLEHRRCACYGELEWLALGLRRNRWTLFT